jgi:hypothetical protein
MVSEYAIWRENNERMQRWGQGKLFICLHPLGFPSLNRVFLFLEPREAESLPLPTMENKKNYGDVIFMDTCISVRGLGSTTDEGTRGV